MIYIVLAILVLEIARLSIQLLDSHRVNKLNQKMTAHLMEKEDQWLKLRQSELDGMKDLVEGSKSLEDIYNDFKKALIDKS